MLAVVEDIGYSIRKLEIGILSSPRNDRTCYDLVKQLSHYLYFFSFHFSFGLTIQGRSIGKCISTFLSLTTTISSLLAMMAVGGTTILPNLLH